MLGSLTVRVVAECCGHVASGTAVDSGLRVLQWQLPFPLSASEQEGQMLRVFPYSNRKNFTWTAFMDNSGKPLGQWR